ncbi:hypothetical protein DERF_010986 [Dermatophagoides farinae]|uniref:Uncharacterized protein n=1 Tax=Dermatophagoides farinae TaxID=6954 RepID=A0A922L4C8_DERFA|nr:hypothetical protein DERF_010986 [Dermatophagoides farinae]
MKVWLMLTINKGYGVGWARIQLRCASYDEPTVYWPWTRRVGISLVQLTLILGLIKRSFCDNTDPRIFYLVRRDFDVVAVDGAHDWP